MRPIVATFTVLASSLSVPILLPSGGARGERINEISFGATSRLARECRTFPRLDTNGTSGRPLLARDRTIKRSRHREHRPRPNENFSTFTARRPAPRATAEVCATEICGGTRGGEEGEDGRLDLRIFFHGRQFSSLTGAALSRALEWQFQTRIPTVLHT